MNSKKNIFLFLSVILYSINNFSQTDTTKENYNHAIQFYILDELIAGYKYHFTENSAVRLIVNATGLFKDEDIDRIELRDNNTDTLINYSNWEFITSNQFFEIKVQYLHHFRIHKIFQLFLGTGPFINYRFTQDEERRKTYDPESGETYWYLYSTRENSWNVGASALAGLECNIYNNINLFVEYEAVVSLGWKDYNRYGTNHTFSSANDKDDINTWSYELKGLRIGAGIYF